jgi:hypothetical protein
MTQKDVGLYYYVKVYLKQLIKIYLNKQLKKKKHWSHIFKSPSWYSIFIKFISNLSKCSMDTLGILFKKLIKEINIYTTKKKKAKLSISNNYKWFFIAQLHLLFSHVIKR